MRTHADLKKYEPGLIDAFMQFARNGRWGTCAGCPSTDGQRFPEFCEDTNRYDHKLTLEGLTEAYGRYLK